MALFSSLIEYRFVSTFLLSISNPGQGDGRPALGINLVKAEIILTSNSSIKAEISSDDLLFTLLQTSSSR